MPENNPWIRRVESSGVVLFKESHTVWFRSCGHKLHQTLAFWMLLHVQMRTLEQRGSPTSWVSSSLLLGTMSTRICSANRCCMLDDDDDDDGGR